MRDLYGVESRWRPAAVRAVAGPALDFWLNGAEQATLATLPPRRRADWLAGRLAAKSALRALLHLQIPPCALEIGNAPAGTPRVRGIPAHPPVYLSIAHRLGRGAALAGHDPVGIDLEPIRDRPPGWELSLLAPGEGRAWQERFPARRELGLTAAWCLKEAALKALGLGLGLPLGQVRLQWRNEGLAGIAVADRARGEGRWSEWDGFVVARVRLHADPPSIPPANGSGP